MRQDMHHVVHDHLRHSRGIPLKPGRPPREVDDLPSRESIRRPYHQAYGRAMKESNEKFTPLLRYLVSRVGRPWSEVYAELRGRFDARSPAAYRPLARLRDWVTTTDLFVKNGTVLEARQYDITAPVVGLYVHPETGILCCAGDVRFVPFSKRLRSRFDLNGLAEQEFSL